MTKVPFETLVARNLQSSGVQTQLPQDGGVHIGDVMRILHRMEAQFIGRSMDDASPDASPRHPDAETERVMIPSIGSLGTRRPAELGREDDNGIVEEPALLQILEESCCRTIDLQGQLAVVFPEFGMLIPGPRGPITVHDLDEAHAALDKAPGRQ